MLPHREQAQASYFRGRVSMAAGTVLLHDFLKHDFHSWKKKNIEHVIQIFTCPPSPIF